MSNFEHLRLYCLHNILIMYGVYRVYRVYMTGVLVIQSYSIFNFNLDFYSDKHNDPNDERF